MSSVKRKLKFTREALDEKNYARAKEAALEVLNYEPDNYNAHVFLGLALLELDETKDSEEAYQAAIKLQPNNQLAWQGISRLYERAERWPEYTESLNHLMDLQLSLNDAARCAETIQKVIDLCRKKGYRLELINALSLLLPNSPFYPLLSTLLPPDESSHLATSTIYIQKAVYESLPVLQEVASLLEAHEEDLYKREVEKRKTRLGAPSPEVLQKQVGQDVWSSSRLPLIYSEIIHHPESPDALRHETESKLLGHNYRYLCSLIDNDASREVREDLLQDINDLTKGAVLLKKPDSLAWRLSLEQQDFDSVETCDSELIRSFIDLFPSSPTAKLLSNFFLYMGLDLLGVREDRLVLPEREETYMEIQDAYSDISDTIFANRALAEVHLKDGDYKSAVKFADMSLSLLERTQREMKIHLHRTKVGIMAIKVTSLVYLNPPKYHKLASAIISEVLSQCPTNVPCLLGRAIISQTEKRWKEAYTIYLNVADLLPEDSYSRLRAIEDAAWCQYKCGQLQEGLASLQRALSSFFSLAGRETDRARCLWRIGQCYWTLSGDYRQESYRSYIASLKQDPSYAPSFTSLGLYYADIVPPDMVRASKCFQKAFELDARQDEAARRLAESFAADQAWDLVDFVAHRAIEEGDAGGVLDIHTLGSSELPPVKSWAWQAIGIVELIRGNYSNSIRALQTALKNKTHDGLLWSRLGEAYSKSGRYAAALKALSKAEELVPDDWSCQYFLADVKRNTGDYLGAIAAYTKLLSNRPGELVILVSLVQTYLDLGRTEQLEGFQERAERSFLSAMQITLKAIQEHSSSRIACGKLLADALFYLSAQVQYQDHIALSKTLTEIIREMDPYDEDDVADIIPQPNVVQVVPVTQRQVMLTAITVYRNRLLKMYPGSSTSGSPWYDVAMGLQAWASREKAEHEAITKKSIFYLRRALQEDVHNDTYWASLGTVYFQDQPTLAQHAFIRALEINGKSVTNWANLGIFYLQHNDFELANDAFVRAQTLDPDNATAWIAQAFLHSTTGFESKAQDLLSHAIQLKPVQVEADREFARGVSQQYMLSSQCSLDSFSKAFFALHRYNARRPDDPFALHLFGLISENLGLHILAETLIRRSVGLLETEYEETEDPLVERFFATANYNLARLCLAQLDVAGAVELFQDVLGLLTGEHDGFSAKLRIQAYLGYGLAKFMQQESYSSLELFEAASTHAEDNLPLKRQADILLAHATWTIDKDESREIAKTRLLQCIASDPTNIPAIASLAGMGVLSGDENLIDATLSELLGMTTAERHQLDPSGDINYILAQQCLSRHEYARALVLAQRTLHAAPSNVNARNKLAALALQQQEQRKALAILLGDPGNIAQGSATSAERLCLLAVSHALSGSPADVRLGLRVAQKAVMLVPCGIRTWQTVAFIRSLSVSSR